MYLTYAEFTDKGGTELSEAAFSRYAYRAKAEIDRYTQGRITDGESEALKRCMIEVIDAFFKADEATENNVASVSNDGMSVAYRDMTCSQTELAQTVRRLVLAYLPEYCYRGVDDV